jgi:hypothetical protein
MSSNWDIDGLEERKDEIIQKNLTEDCPERRIWEWV